jgi:outer membrane protein assembly factor BamA
MMACLAAGPALPASRIAVVEVGGNRAMSSGEVRRVTGLEPGAAYDSASASAGLDALLARYRELGRLFAEVRLQVEPDTGEVSVRLQVAEGPAARIGRVEVVGGGSVAGDALGASLELQPGRLFQPEALERDVRRILGACAEAGHPYAAVRPADFSDSLGLLSFRYLLDEGVEVRLRKFEVVGNHQTPGERVIRRAGIRPDALYRLSAVDHAVWRLRRLGAFEQVDAGLVAGRTEPTLRYRVREGGTSSIQGALGYSGTTQTVSGLFDLDLQNLGGGRSAHFRLDARGAGVTEYSLGGREPLVFSSPFSLDVQIGQHLEDTLYTQSQGRVSLAAEVVPYGIASVGGEYERVVQSAGDILRDRGLKLALGFEWDRRDDPLAPTRGILVKLQSRIGSRALSPRVAGPDTHNSTREDQLEFEGYAGLGSPSRVLALHGLARALSTDADTVPVYRQYTLGGATSLRGYDEQQFRGTAVGLLSAEVRWLSGEGGYVFVFAEAGYVRRQVQGQAGDLVRPGYGVGLRMRTSLGFMGLDYAWGESQSPLGGKIHASIRSRF